MLKIKKKYEMEKEIERKSIFISYYFCQFALIILIIINCITKKNIVIPLYFLIMANVVKKTSDLIYRHSVEDERWKKGLMIFLLSILLVLFILTISPTIGVINEK